MKAAGGTESVMLGVSDVQRLCWPSMGMRTEKINGAMHRDYWTER